MKNLIKLFIDFVSQYTISSYYFWLYIIRGGIIYGFVSASVGLIHAVELIHRKEDDSIRSAFQESYTKNKSHIGLSFLLFLFSGLSLMSIYPPLHETLPILTWMQIPILIWTFLLWTIAIYSIYFLAHDQQNAHSAKWIYALAFDTCIRHPLRSLVILLMIVAFTLIIKVNLVAFIFLAPPLLIIATKKIVFIPKILTN
jgi:uncharacterized membrane protein YesL